MGLQGLVHTIALLAVVLGCLGAANVVGIAVAERTAELGLRKALGATPTRIRMEVLTETLLLCLLGGVLGVLIGSLAIALLGPLEFSDTALVDSSGGPLANDAGINHPRLDGDTRGPAGCQSRCTTEPSGIVAGGLGAVVIMFSAVPPLSRTSR